MIQHIKKSAQRVGGLVAERKLVEGNLVEKENLAKRRNLAEENIAKREKRVRKLVGNSMITQS